MVLGHKTKICCPTCGVNHRRPPNNCEPDRTICYTLLILFGDGNKTLRECLESAKANPSRFPRFNREEAERVIAQREAFRSYFNAKGWGSEESQILNGGSSTKKS